MITQNAYILKHDCYRENSLTKINKASLKLFLNLEDFHEQLALWKWDIHSCQLVELMKGKH